MAARWTRDAAGASLARAISVFGGNRHRNVRGAGRARPQLPAPWMMSACGLALVLAAERTIKSWLSLPHRGQAHPIQSCQTYGILAACPLRVMFVISRQNIQGIS